MNKADGLLIKNYEKRFDEKLKERFFHTYKFSNHDLNKSILLLQILLDDCEKFNETSLPEKENFYSHLNTEDITNADYAHRKRVCENLEIKKTKKTLENIIICMFKVIHAC